VGFVHVDVVLKDDRGEVLGEMMAAEKQFKTGSRGFYANGKLEIAGKRYQVQVQLVEIGSKVASG
jgi:hypothetical protein